MQPESRKWFFARCSFRLCDLIVVVYRHEINPSRMDVYLLAQDRVDHRRTLDVPPRKALAPRAVPPHLRVSFPKHEVGRAALLGLRLDACAALLSFQIDITELAVIGEFSCIEINTAFYAIRITFFLESLDESNLCRNIFTCVGKANVFHIHIERAQVVLEDAGVLSAHLEHIFKRWLETIALKALCHFVVAGIRIG